MASEFFDLFRQPEWLECERRVIAATGGTCANCGNTAPLRVHHSYYEKDRMPWDYPIASLHALCEACKREAEEHRVELRRQIGLVSYIHSERLLGYAQALEAFDHPETTIHVRSYEHAEGIGDTCGVTAETILRRMVNETVTSALLEEIFEEQRPRRVSELRGGA